MSFRRSASLQPTCPGVRRSAAGLRRATVSTSLATLLMPLLLFGLLPLARTGRAEPPVEDLLAKAGRDLTPLVRLLNSPTVPWEPEEGEDGPELFARYLAGVQRALEANPELSAEVGQPVTRWAPDLRNLLVWGYVVRAYHQAMAKTLSQLIALPTVAEGERPEVARASRTAFTERLEGLCKSWGLTLRRQDDGRLLEISLPVPGKAEVQVLAVADTAPAAPEGWRHPPFAGALTPREVVGRGAVSKGGLVAALYALKAVRDSRVPLPARPVLLVSFAGEAARQGGKAVLPAKTLAGAAFVAAGAFPVEVGESGLASFTIHSPPDPPGVAPLEGVPGFKLLELTETPGSPAVASALLDPRETPLRRAEAIARRSLSQWALAHPGTQGTAQVAEDKYLRVTFSAGPAAQPAATAQAPVPEPGMAGGEPAAGTLAVAPAPPDPLEPPSALPELLAFLGRELGLFPDWRGRLARFVADRVALARDGRELGLAFAHSRFPATRLAVERWETTPDGGVQVQLTVRWPPGTEPAAVIRSVDRAAAAHAQAEGGTLRVRGHALAPHLLPPEDARLRPLVAAYEEATHKPAYTFTSAIPGVAKGFGPAPVFGPLAPGHELLPGQPDEAIGLDELVTAARIYCVAWLKLADEARARRR